MQRVKDNTIYKKENLCANTHKSREGRMPRSLLMVGFLCKTLDNTTDLYCKDENVFF